MAVQQLYMNKDKQREYLKEHNIKEVAGIEMCGCCIVKTELKDESWTTIVFERFDGVTLAITLKELIQWRQQIFKWGYTPAYELFNMEFYGKSNKYEYKKHYNRVNYIPTKKSIHHYLWKYGMKTEINDDDMIVKPDNINLTKEQFDAIQYKLKMLGVRWKLVDYNTFIVVDKQMKMIIYSTQKMIA
jgi:hypothetical protein